MGNKNGDIIRYKIITNADGYVDSFYDVVGDEYDYEGQMADYPEATEGWYKFINNEFIVDEDKKAEIIAERKRKAQEPTREDRIEAQATYTAMMTDTLLEE